MKIIEQIMAWSIKSDMLYEEEHRPIFKTINEMILRVLIFYDNIKVVDQYLYTKDQPSKVRLGLKSYILAVLQRAKFKINSCRKNALIDQEVNFRYEICLLRIKYFMNYLNNLKQG